MVEFSEEKVAEFLALFDGDVVAAQESLRDFARNHQNSQNPHAKTPQTQVWPTPGKENIISLNQVSKHYKLGKQTVRALNSVSLAIGKGEFVAIIGASGSGKSTLLQLIGCLDKPTSGEIIVGGKNIRELKDSALSDLRKQTIGFIFQSFYLQPFLRLHDNVAVPAMFSNENRTEINAKVDSLLTKVGLHEHAKRFPKELSGGQIQRAAIARALINNPQIILADEPTGNLDSANSATIIDLFLKIRETFSSTVVIVTHDENIAAKADRIIRLKDGEIA